MGFAPRQGMGPAVQEPIVLVAAPAFPAGLQIQEILLRVGIESMLAESAGELLRHARDRKIDVLVLDTSLPHFDCASLIPLVRELQKDVPVIVCTNEHSAEQELAVRRNEVAFYAIRPDDLVHLAELVERNRRARAGSPVRARETLAAGTQGG